MSPGADSNHPEIHLHLAETGERAVELVEEGITKGQRFAAGFFDVRLGSGGMDGVEAMRAVRDLDPDILCAVVTAYNDYSLDSIRSVFPNQDEWIYVNKPFTEAELRQFSLNLVSGWLMRRERRTHLDTIQRQQHDLQRSYEESMKRISRAVEFRDDETGMHVHRMSCYCVLIAKKLGLSEERCRAIGVASQLHDVGKIGIPDNILQKQGKLTADEFTKMKQHPEIGRSLLAGSASQLLELASVIAHTHHERFDGQGYPRGLRGEEIPLEGRISAIADVFDALTTDRVYRPAMTVEAAIGLMRGEMVKHFDPALLATFCEMLPEIETIRATLLNGTVTTTAPSLAEHAVAG